MKDLDFDELDKAVNSLMATAEEVNAAPETVLPQSPPVAVEPTTPTPVAAQLGDESVATVASAPASERPAPTQRLSLATKRSGRFMDVVHPSSDMKKIDKPMVNRTAQTVAPVNSIVESASPVSEQAGVPAAPLVSDPDVELPTGLQTAETTIATADVVDTVAVDEQPESTEVSTANDPELELSDSLTTDTSDMPSTSPFIPDAKVEKRPLGGALPSEEVSMTEKFDESQEETNEPVVEHAASLTSTPTGLPPELHQDVAAIEAGVPSEAEAAPATKPEVAAGSSIAPQYKEAPQTDEKRHEALYDSAAKGAPLAHPTKKKSGWTWVIWIVLLIILGAGAAAVFYYFKPL